MPVRTAAPSHHIDRTDHANVPIERSRQGRCRIYIEKNPEIPISAQFQAKKKDLRIAGPNRRPR